MRMLLHNEPTKRIRRLKYIRLPHAHGTDRPGCARVASRYPLQRRRRERMDVDDRPALSAENAGSQRSGDPEIRGDFHRIVYAANAEAARAAYATFERTWAKRCAGVVASLREGGDELLTFFSFPKVQWKTLRTTNTIERLHEEFRRRVKTQRSLPSEDAALVLLFSLVASGQIKLRRIDGWQKIGAVLSERTAVAA